jgi:MinD superfamily P-loop ATPase
MKEVVIISGKGGTGKTSIVASFAAMDGKKVLADCDVDAADLHLILEPTVQSSEAFYGGNEAVIRTEDCVGCGECEARCRFGAVRVGRNQAGETTYSIDPIACEGCGVCVYVCPVDAIDFTRKKNGEWFISDTRHGTMVHAKLGIAEENSGKLVTLVRNQAKQIAKEQGAPLIIVDGAPGIGCPVIASITGADMVLVVTEPTMSGLHDLERVVALARHFSIRTVVCINKFDLNEEMTAAIEHRTAELGAEVIGRVRYDVAVTKAQLEKKSIVEYCDTEVTREIKNMWSRLQETLCVEAEAVE